MINIIFLMIVQKYFGAPREESATAVLSIMIMILIMIIMIMIIIIMIIMIMKMKEPCKTGKTDDSEDEATDKDIDVRIHWGAATNQDIITFRFGCDQNILSGKE